MQSGVGIVKGQRQWRLSDEKSAYQRTTGGKAGGGCDERPLCPWLIARVAFRKWHAACHAAPTGIAESLQSFGGGPEQQGHQGRMKVEEWASRVVQLNEQNGNERRQT